MFCVCHDPLKSSRKVHHLTCYSRPKSGRDTPSVRSLWYLKYDSVDHLYAFRKQSVKLYSHPSSVFVSIVPFVLCGNHKVALLVDTSVLYAA